MRLLAYTIILNLRLIGLLGMGHSAQAARGNRLTNTSAVSLCC